MIREDLVQELHDAGHDVRFAANGKVGLDLVNSFQPELILSDYLMPVMSGEELLRSVRQESERFNRIPFVFLSANTKLPAGGDEHGPGTTVYLRKPVDFDELMTTIDSLLGQGVHIRS